MAEDRPQERIEPHPAQNSLQYQFEYHEEDNRRNRYNSPRGGGNFQHYRGGPRSGGRNKAGGGGRNGIPDRWLKYDPIGKDIAGARFVAFKTPLHERFFQNKPDLHPDDFFDTHTLLQYARQAGKKIGMVIDLTNTNRYYEKEDFEKEGVVYQKIFCPGHEVNTREDIVHKFNKIVDDYLEQHADDDTLIGVHCTHGLNRTGYLIGRYLIDRMNWTADEAIKQFEEARGHPIERAPYKRTLQEASARIHGTQENPEEQEEEKNE